jgi:hypothetical protein
VPRSVFAHMIEKSQHLTIRIVCFPGGPLRGDLPAASAKFSGLGTYIEGVPQYGMLAIDIPPQSPLAHIGRVLEAGGADGSWDIDEGRINDAWRALD